MIEWIKDRLFGQVVERIANGRIESVRAKNLKFGDEFKIPPCVNTYICMSDPFRVGLRVNVVMIPKEWTLRK